MRLCLPRTWLLGSVLGVGAILAPVAQGAAAAATPTASPATVAHLDSISCPATNYCMAVGAHVVGKAAQPLVDTWNGAVWTALAPPTPRGAVAAYLRSVQCEEKPVFICMAVGGWVNTSKITETLAESWDVANRTWKIHSTPNPGRTSGHLAGVSCLSSSYCVAAGEWAASATSTALFVERWNGSTWAEATMPDPKSGPNPHLLGVSCVSTSFCSAVGYYQKGSGSGPLVTLGELWNGKQWSIQATPNASGVVSTATQAVACTSSSSCVAVGQWANSAGTTWSYAEIWNGKGWAYSAPSSQSGTLLAGVSCSGATCMAVGHASYTWNGHSWAAHAIGTTVNSTNDDLLAASCVSGRCVATGQYSASSNTLPLGETWSGSVWAVHNPPA